MLFERLFMIVRLVALGKSTRILLIRHLLRDVPTLVYVSDVRVEIVFEPSRVNAGVTMIFAAVLLVTCLHMSLEVTQTSEFLTANFAFDLISFKPDVILQMITVSELPYVLVADEAMESAVSQRQFLRVSQFLPLFALVLLSIMNVDVSAQSFFGIESFLAYLAMIHESIEMGLAPVRSKLVDAVRFVVAVSTRVRQEMELGVTRHRVASASVEFALGALKHSLVSDVHVLHDVRLHRRSGDVFET